MWTRQAQHIYFFLAVLSGQSIQSASFTPTTSKLNVITLRHELPDEKNVPTYGIGQLAYQLSLKQLEKKSIVLIGQSGLYEQDAYTAYRGIKIRPTDDVVFIYVRGYARASQVLSKTPGLEKMDALATHGGGVYAAGLWLRAGLCSAPCVCFDLPDTRDIMDLGQANDTACLMHVYNRIREQNPHARIVLMGSCRGGKIVLNFLTKKPANIAAVILESPLFSVKALCERLAKTRVWFLPGSNKILKKFFNAWFTNLDIAHDNLLRYIKRIDPNIPILIGHLDTDILISNDQCITLMQHLQQRSPQHTYLLPLHVPSIPHARLDGVPTFVQAVNAFLWHYHLPHASNNVRSSLLNMMRQNAALRHYSFWQYV